MKISKIPNVYADRSSDFENRTALNKQETVTNPQYDKFSSMDFLSALGKSSVTFKGIADERGNEDDKITTVCKGVDDKIKYTVESDKEKDVTTDYDYDGITIKRVEVRDKDKNKITTTNYDENHQIESITVNENREITTTVFKNGKPAVKIIKADDGKYEKEITLNSYGQIAKEKISMHEQIPRKTTNMYFEYNDSNGLIKKGMIQEEYEKLTRNTSFYPEGTPKSVIEKHFDDERNCIREIRIYMRKQGTQSLKQIFVNGKVQEEILYDKHGEEII